MITREVDMLEQVIVAELPQYKVAFAGREVRYEAHFFARFLVASRMAVAESVAQNLGRAAGIWA